MEDTIKNMLLRLLLILVCSVCMTSSYTQEISDTIREKERLNTDSLKIHLQLVRDSLLSHEQFVRDSIRLRQQRLDSLTFLQKELDVLLEAYFRTVKEDIILRCGSITIIGDSVLSEYEYLLLPFSTTQPYRPWNPRLDLADKSIKVVVDKKIQKITSIQAPFMWGSFIYDNRNNVLIINERNFIQNHYSEKFYTTPFDSVFFDRYDRVGKIKRYVQFYKVINNNMQGAPLFLNLSQVIQYEYDANNQITKYQTVKFCERWKVYEANKVCSILTYTFTKQGNTYMLSRRNEPANAYSDGTYTFEYDGNDDLKSLSFHNISNTENWQRTIELNKDGNVSCYIDKTKDIIRQSLCMIYHLQEPNVKYKVETIITTFEEDGISYYQKNNTTGLSRTRDRMTLEWSPWK